MFCFHVSKLRFVVRSNQEVTEPTIGSVPAASRTSPSEKSGTSPSPFAFQRVSASEGGREGDGEERRLAEPAGEQEGQRRPREEERVRGLERERDAGQRSREHGLAVCALLAAL